MSYERPGWAGGPEMTQSMPAYKMVNVDVGQFIRTRDALTSAYLALSSNLDRAVKAYLDHTQVVLNGDATLNISQLLQPFNLLTQQAQMAQMAMAQQTGGIAPGMLSNGGMPPPSNGKVKSEEPASGKRKKRAYKPRDPNAPKRPLTAYFRYLGEMRPTISSEIATNPELFGNKGKPGDISRIATDRWNALSEDQQRPYKEAYQRELKDYEVAVTKYKAAGGNVEDLTQVGDSTLGGVGDDLFGVGAGEVADADADAEGEIEVDVGKVDVESEDDSSSSASSSEDDEEEEIPAPAPPPPAKGTPKKSAMKKTKAGPDPAPEPAKSSSPSRKRKGTDTAAADTTSTKRSRKVKADEEVAQAAAPVAPMASIASSPDATNTPAVKKDKKKKKH